MMHGVRLAVAELSRTTGFSLEDIEDAARALRLAGASSWAEGYARALNFPEPHTSARQIQDALERLESQIRRQGYVSNDIPDDVPDAKPLRVADYRARRAAESATASLRTHPDRGGTSADFVRVNAAHQLVKTMLGVG